MSIHSNSRSSEEAEDCPVIIHGHQDIFTAVACLWEPFPRFRETDHSESTEPESEPAAVGGWRADVSSGTPVLRRLQYPRVLPWPAWAASSVALALPGVLSDSGSGSSRPGPYSCPDITPLSLHLLSLPLADLNSHICPQPGTGPSEILENNNHNRTCPRISRQIRLTHPRPTTHTHDSPRSPIQVVSSLHRCKPWSRPAELVCIGHSKSSGSGRAGSTLRISGLRVRQSASQPKEPRAVSRPAGTRGAGSSSDSFVLGVLPLTAPRAWGSLPGKSAISRANGSSADQRVLPHLPEATNKVRCVCVCMCPRGTREGWDGMEHLNLTTSLASHTPEGLFVYLPACLSIYQLLTRHIVVPDIQTGHAPHASGASSPDMPARDTTSACACNPSSS